MIKFRSVRKLCSYLVKAILYPSNRVAGSYKCNGKRCIARMNVNETSNMARPVDHETCIINHYFKCSDKCLIYLITYKLCLKQLF